MDTKVCNKCGREMPLNAFYKKTKSPDGYQSTCRFCHNEYMMIRNQAKRREKEALKGAMFKDVKEAVDNAPKDAVTIVTKDGRTLHKVTDGCKPLKDYTARELLAELKGRGYIWENMWIKQRIEYVKI